MPQRTDTFDFAPLGLRSGEGRRLDLHVGIDDFHYGGEPYAVTPALVPVRLDVSRTTGNGYALRLRFDAALEGPCMRCLEPAAPTFEVDAREVSQPGGGEELSSPYVVERGARTGAVGARRAGAHAAGADRVPRGLRRTVRPVRRQPERGPGAPATRRRRIRAGRSSES